MRGRSASVAVLVLVLGLAFAGSGSGGEKKSSPGTTTAFEQPAGDVSTAFSGAGSTDLQSASKAPDELADKAPSEIHDDFQVLAQAYDKIAAALGGMNLQSGKAPSADVIQRLQKLRNEIDQQKPTAAEQHISAWVQRGCRGWLVAAGELGEELDDELRP